ncbi:MAG: hypothetical protein Q4B19_07735 [Clostridia bacterium]|nr:hypothetical protein [Clostridia bacterium]
MGTTAQFVGASGEVFSPVGHLICAALLLPFPANFLRRKKWKRNFDIRKGETRWACSSARSFPPYARHARGMEKGKERF